jgi:hypothetical protein
MDNIKFGLIQDLPDFRDYKYTPVVADYPSKVNLLEQYQIDLKDQEDIGACTAFATTSMLEFVRAKQSYRKWNISPLFTYYATRTIENSTDKDDGATVRDAIKSTVQYGVAKEAHWLYDTSKVLERPPDNVWVEAEKHQALKYYRLNNRNKDDLLSCLNEGYPFVFGVRLFQSFKDNYTKELVPVPDWKTETFLGAHCMLCVGYEIDEAGKVLFHIQNSWGILYGKLGYSKIPLEYFSAIELAWDFWTIRLAEGDERDLDPSLPDEVDPVPTTAPTATPIVTVVPATAPPQPIPVIVVPTQAPTPGPAPLIHPTAAPTTAPVIAPPTSQPIETSKNKWDFQTIFRISSIILFAILALLFVIIK